MEWNTADQIKEECDALCVMLQKKNASYGDSALSPIRCFSKADSLENLKVRLDDKLSRLMRGNGEFDEDVVLDILGYLILMRIAVKRLATERGARERECSVKAKPTTFATAIRDEARPEPGYWNGEPEPS